MTELLKREQTCVQLRRTILADFRPGARLPAEREWAASLGCARKTLRYALDLLERERLIVRNTHGTFVFDGAARERLNLEPEPVTILIPSPDFFSTDDRVAHLWHNQFIQGAMRAALEHGTHIVTLPVSPTNTPEDIDYSRLAHLGPESMVLFLNTWYRQVCPFLIRRRCRLGFCFDRRIPEVFDVPEADFMAFSYSELEERLPELVRGCFAGKRKRVFFFATAERLRDGWEAPYRAALAESGLEVNDSFRIYDASMPLRERLRLLGECYRQHRFDALIFELVPTVEKSYFFDLYEETGIPPDLEMVTTTPILPHLQRISPQLRISYYPHCDYGYRLAKFLLSRQRGRHIVPGEFAYPHYHDFIHHKSIPKLKREEQK